MSALELPSGFGDEPKEAIDRIWAAFVRDRLEVFTSHDPQSGCRE